MAIGATRIDANIATNLSSLMREVEGQGGDKHIREQKDGIGLHTSSKLGGAIANFFAEKFDGAFRRTQTEERSAGAEKVWQAVKNEYSEDIANAVFKRLSNGDKSLSNGVTVSDLKSIKHWADMAKTSANVMAERTKLDLESNDDSAFIYRGDDHRLPSIGDAKIELPNDSIRLQMKLDQMEKAADTGPSFEVQLAEKKLNLQLAKLQQENLQPGTPVSTFDDMPSDLKELLDNLEPVETGGREDDFDVMSLVDQELDRREQLKSTSGPEQKPTTGDSTIGRVQSNRFDMMTDFKLNESGNVETK